MQRLQLSRIRIPLAGVIVVIAVLCPTAIAGISMASASVPTNPIEVPCPGSTCPYTAPTAVELGAVENMLARENLERAAATRAFTWKGTKTALQPFALLSPTSTAGQTAQAAAELGASENSTADYGGPTPTGTVARTASISVWSGDGSTSVSDGALMTSFPHALAILAAVNKPEIAIGVACNLTGNMVVSEQLYLNPATNENTDEESAELASDSVYAESGGTITKVSDKYVHTATAKEVLPTDPVEAGTDHPFATGVDWTCAGPQYAPGSAPVSPLPQPVVSIASSATGHGYYLANADGAISVHGDADFEGGANGLNLSKPIVHMQTTPTGGGYWLVASDGGIFTYGDADFFGSMGGKPLNAPIVSMAGAPTSTGYWEVASDGGVFAFGSAAFYGSMGGKALNEPIVGIVATENGNGYWEVAADGGVFAFGNATFVNSLPGIGVHIDDIVGIVPTPNEEGYWLVGATGGIFAFGDAGFENSLPGIGIHVDDIVGLTVPPSGSGYWLASSSGAVYAFGVPFYGAD